MTEAQKNSEVQEEEEMATDSSVKTDSTELLIQADSAEVRNVRGLNVTCSGVRRGREGGREGGRQGGRQAGIDGYD